MLSSPLPTSTRRRGRALVGALLTGMIAVVPATAAAGSPAPAAPDPGRVVYALKAPAAAAASARSRTAAAQPRVRAVPDVGRTLAQLRARKDVRYAVRDARARAAAPFVPNDPGAGTTPGGWQASQWNFSGPASVNAPDAWANLIAVNHPGGRGVTVAVLDTGVAYRATARTQASPDLRQTKFVRGYDFVDGDERPVDRNGHGTHVTSTIAESTNNGIGLTGLAYGVRIMPVRVLDNDGTGYASTIARGVRYAADRGAQVINLSLEFLDEEASDIPQLLEAIRHAHRKGAVIVGASGNEALRRIAYPARAPNVISVGATTEHGCLSRYSNQGTGLDVVAPGGGPDAFLPDPGCAPNAKSGRDILQITLTGFRKDRFGIPSDYDGTSMAAPHVSAAAALVIASGILGRKPTPAAVEKRLKQTARDLGAPGPDSLYGAGLIDAAAATSPLIPVLK